MKVCPKCGYVDESIWKHSRYGWDCQQDYCALDTFKEWHPDIAKILEEKKIFRDKINFYRLSKKGYVYRIALIDEHYYHSHGYTESPKKKPKR